MSKIKLKICGMREPQNITEVAALMPDYMGFIFFEKSPRDVMSFIHKHEILDINQTISIRNLQNTVIDLKDRYASVFETIASLPSIIEKVGVFVNAPSDFILRQVEALNLSLVQLHGKESVAQVEELKTAGIKVIKVFSVDDDFDFAVTKPYKAVADYFLFDTKGQYHGGNAKTFNWRVLEAYDQDVPFFLSGGIGPDNIKDVAIIRNMNIHALDVNSGVEKKPAVKDIEKIKDLQRNIKLHL